VSHRRKLGYEWGYWRDWWQNFECGVSGSAYYYTGDFRFNIPTPPAGAHLVISRVRIYEAGYNNASTHYVAVNGGSLDFTPPTYSRPTGGTNCPDPVTPCWMGYWPWWYSLTSGSGGGSYRTYYAQLELVYEYDGDQDYDEDAVDITDDGATLTAFNVCEEAWFEYDEKEHGFGSPHSTPHTSQQGKVTFTLTGLKPDTWYWYRFVMLCKGVRKEGKIFWFKTKKTDDWNAYIITLPATEVWSTGATIHGMLHYTGDSRKYLYLGFQYGPNSDISGEAIRWTYSGYFTTGRYPIQQTIAGLLPDRTYYYRACLHVGPPPFGVNEYFGSTLSFGGPVSMFGFGREYVTAKKAEDDISKLAVGRYYMDKNGIFQYESAKHRIPVDPEVWLIGHEANDGFGARVAANVFYSSIFYNGIAGTMTKIKVWCGGACNVKCAVYDNDTSVPDGRPGNLLACNNVGQACVAGWNSIPVNPSIVLVEGATYWISTISDAAEVGKYTMAYTYGAVSGAQDYAAANWPDPGNPAWAYDNYNNHAAAGWGLV